MMRRCNRWATASKLKSQINIIEMFGKLWDLEENIEKEKIRLYEEIAVDEETDGEAVM